MKIQFICPGWEVKIYLWVYKNVTEAKIDMHHFI